ncbi:MAG: hypothetical protein JW881_14095 [Spirochaetales bacterium]|nr:hypothetical protein [Spirochaetales bacterium]
MVYRKSCLLFILSILILFGFTTIVVYAGENLLRNPGMEQGDIAWWRVWEFNKNISRFEIQTEDPYEGRYYVTIVSDEENDARLVQQVAVNENTVYKISAWVRTDNVGHADTDLLGANLSIDNHFITSPDVKGTTSGWRYLELYVRPERGLTRLPVALCLGGYGSLNTGKASFDAVEVVEVEDIPARAAVFSVPAPRTDASGDDKGGKNTAGGFSAIRLVYIVLLGAVVLALIVTGIIILRKKGIVKRIPDFVGKWIDTFFPQPEQHLSGIKKITQSPYTKGIVALLLVIIIGLPFVHDIWESIEQEPIPGNENHYVYQAKAILEGRIDIGVRLHDTAQYKGKVYVIYPPFPVLILLPFVAVFGLKTEVTLIAILIAVISVILLARILSRLNVKREVRPWVLLAFFLGTGYWLCLRNSLGVCWFAHVVAVFAMLATLHETLGRGNGILAGLFLGFAFLSRQLSIFFALFIVFGLWTNDRRKDMKNRIMHTLFFFSTLGVCVIGYLAFNYIRFGNIFDTGYAYLELGGFMQYRVQEYGQFSMFHIPFNAVYMFLQGFHLNYGDGPNTVTSVHQWWPLDPFGTSLTFASPFVFYSLRARWKKSLLVPAWISIGIVLVGTLMYYNNGWVQYNTQRFSIDFMPLLIILVALGLQHGNKSFFKLLVLMAVVLNAITMLVIPAAG